MNQEKQNIRKQVKAAVKALSAEQRSREAQALLRNISSNPYFKAASHILIYNPLPDEIDVLPILEAYKSTKQFYMPVVAGDILKILPYTAEQKTGAYGIGEPVGEEYASAAEMELIIVPGVAFTKDGHRLGRGKGYYDRLLKQTTAHKIGVCFAVQITPSISTLHEPHDVLMDEVIAI